MPIDRVHPGKPNDTCPGKMRKDLAKLELYFLKGHPYLRLLLDYVLTHIEKA